MPAPSPTALIDRVNEADEPIGVIRRQDVFREHAGFRVAHVLVQNRAGQILLQQVSPKRPRSALRWGSSVAAYLHRGETYAQAARRRLHEELGLRTPIRLIGATHMIDDGAMKFIAIFGSAAEAPIRVDTDHIANWEYLAPTVVAERLAEASELFTETFHYVFQLYLSIESASNFPNR